MKLLAHNGKPTKFDSNNRDIRYGGGGSFNVSYANEQQVNELYDLVSKSNELGNVGHPRLVLIQNNKVIGGIFVDNDYLPYEYMFDIFIKKSKRGKGYSKLLLDAMIKDFVENFPEADQIRGWVINKKLEDYLESKYDFRCADDNQEQILYCYLSKEDAEKLLNNKYFMKGGEITEQDKKETYKKWKDLVNMSASELKKFMDSDEGKEAGLSKQEADKLGIHYGRESAKWILKMKDTPVSEWTPTMWRWAKRQISFNSRMRGNKGKLYDDKGRKTRKHLSLLIWGHNPEKYEGGGVPKIEFVKENTEVFMGKFADGGVIDAKTKIYKIEDYSLDTAMRWLSEWQIDKWKKTGRSKEQIERDIESAKREIKNVEEKTPYTTWHIDLPKGKNEFKIGNSTYKIVAEKEPLEDYGWKSKNWKKNIYSVVKTNDVFSPFDKYILKYNRYQKKEDVVSSLNNYFQQTIQENIDKKYLPVDIKYEEGGGVEETEYGTDYDTYTIANLGKCLKYSNQIIFKNQKDFDKKAGGTVFPIYNSKDKYLGEVLWGDYIKLLDEGKVIDIGAEGLVDDEYEEEVSKYFVRIVFLDEQYADGGEITLTTEQVENKLGRKLHWWNDDVVSINGVEYKKVFLKSEYKRNYYI